MKTSFKITLCLISLAINSNLKAQDLENLNQQVPFKISGTISSNLTFFNADGRASNREPFSWLVQGNPTVSIYGIDIPFSFTISEQSRNFRQPFNQFGLSPTYKWATLHLGHQNLKWSQYSLAGHNFFGVGFEVKPKKFDVGFIYGRFLRAIEPMIGSSTSYSTPSFERIGGALKLGYGTKKHNGAIVVFHAKDDENSINFANASTNIAPSENLVASIRTHHLFFNELLLDIEYARSLYVPNILTPSINTKNDFLLKVFSFLIDEKQGTKLGEAINTVISYRKEKFDIKLRYNRITPDFKSFGAYFFQTDQEKITIEPRARFLKNKLIIGTSFGFQKDNLSNNKATQTKRNIYSFNIGYTPSYVYNLNASYTNYGVTQKPGTQAINNQMELAQVNQQLTVTQNLNLMSKDKSQLHMLFLLWNFQNLSDDNSTTAQFSEFESHILSPKYTYSFMPWQLSAGAGYNYTTFKFTSVETINHGPSINISKAFKKPNINVTTSFNYYQIKTNGVAANDAFIIALQSKYKLGKRHQFSGRIHLNKGNTSGINPLNYSETKIDFGYVYSF